MKKNLKIILFILFPYLGFCQKKTFITCDSASKQPLPSASVRIKDSNTGTMTNEDGRFSLNIKKGIIKISYIGFKSTEVEISNVKDSIFLAEDNVLSELIVMPDSSLKVLLRNAYNNIEKNYPQKQSSLSGFFREVFENITENRFEYFTESFLNVNKPPYSESGKEYEGQVNVQKTRTFKHPNYSKNGTKYVGGPFLSIQLDRVLKRSKEINPKNFKNYTYKLEGLKKIDGNEIYIISASSKDSIFKSTFFINKEDFSYVKFDIINSKIKREKEERYVVNINFEKFDGKYYIQYVKYKDNKFINDKEFGHTAEFLTLKNEQESLNSFRYKDQLLRMDVIADQKNDTTRNFLEEYEGVLSQTNKLDGQIKLAFKNDYMDSSTILKNGLTQKKYFSFKNILIRGNIFIPGIGFGYTPVQMANATFTNRISNIFNDPLDLKNTSKVISMPITIHSMYNFAINKRWRLEYLYGGSLNRGFKLYHKDIGLSYRTVFNKGKKPFFIEPSLRYSFSDVGVTFGEIKNPNRNVEINGKNINSKKISTGIYSTTKGVKIGLSTSIYNGNRFILFKVPTKLYFSVNYYHIINTSEPFLQLKEERFLGFLEKKVKLNLSDNRINFKSNNIKDLPRITSNFWFGLNYRISIK